MAEQRRCLQLANDGTNAFLAAEGVNMLEAWLNTGMAEPYVMATATVTVPEPGPLALLGSGLAALQLLARRRARAGGPRG